MTTTDPTPDFKIQERVSAGAAWLDRTRPRWISELDLDLLELRDCERCVLGQMVVMERKKFIWDTEDPQAEICASETLDGYDCLIDPEEYQRDIIEDVDSLSDLIMTESQACDRGFHLGQNSSIYSNDDEWQELTDEWRRVIVERRAR